MEFRPIERGEGAFQEPVAAEVIEDMCRRAFGSHVGISSAVELGNGMYNNTYRIDTEQAGAVILRVAPESARQNRIERCLMRNEYASIPYLAPLASMMPRTLAADFTHEITGRDYMVQTMLEGVPGPDGLGQYRRERWGSFFRQMGAIARGIHAVRGERFGPVAGPGCATWGEAVAAFFADLVADLDEAGLDSTDVREVLAATDTYKAVLNEVTEPRLLHGDLWTVNVMLDPEAAEPTITGVFDNDRTSWGDPEADWTIFMAAKKPGTERDAFWESYGSRPSTPNAARRSLFYRARHIGAIRLERHRLGNADAVPETYRQMREVLERLQA